MLNQFQFCEENGVPFCVVIGESEIEKGEVTLRDMSSRNEVTTITHLSLTKHCWFLFFVVLIVVLDCWQCFSLKISLGL